MGQFRYIHNEPVYRKYYANFWSFAFLLQVGLYAFLLTIPFLAAYRSGGFWIKEATFREQPDVRFKHEIIVTAQGNDGEFFTWSTYPSYNSIMQQFLRPVLIQSSELDENHDGLKDRLDLDLSLPLDVTANIARIQLLLLFQYKIKTFSDVTMESAVYIGESASINAGSLWVSGDLKLEQANPIPHSGTRTIYNVPVVDAASTRAEDFDLTTIFERYLQRNDTTYLDYHYPVWKGPRAPTAPLKIHATVNYPSQLFTYEPGFWEEIKWGWIQYLAYLFPMWYFATAIRDYAFANQLVVATMKIPSLKSD